MEADCDSFGDLGLGHGLRPGAVWHDDRVSCPPWGERERTSASSSSVSSSSSSYDLFHCRPQLLSSNVCYRDEGEGQAVIGDYVDATATRTKSDEGQMTSVAGIQKNGCGQNQNAVTECSTHSSANNFYGSVTKVKQQLTEQEVEELKQDLELCQMQLCAKYQATKILQEQLATAKKEKEILSNRFENLNKTLSQEVNRVQFELKCHESKLLESQEKWSAKFDSICLENLRLSSDLEKQTLKQRKLYAEKMALSRERDELIALMHINERSKYESVQSTSSDLGPFNEFTSLELALLGACRCHSESCSPCACAVTAACLKKEVFRSKEELDQLRRERDDAFAMADIYRIAFDEQLSRNCCLIRQTAELCKEMDDQSSGCHEKFRSSIVRLLKKEDNGLSNSHSENSESIPANVELNNEQRMEDLMKRLEETVVDKSEALAHQKFATRLLAIRVRQLEEKLSATRDDEITNVVAINNCTDDVS